MLRAGSWELRAESSQLSVIIRFKFPVLGSNSSNSEKNETKKCEPPLPEEISPK